VYLKTMIAFTKAVDKDCYVDILDGACSRENCSERRLMMRDCALCLRKCYKDGEQLQRALTMSIAVCKKTKT